MISLKIFYTSVPLSARANRKVAAGRQPIKTLFSYDADFSTNRSLRRTIWRLTSIPG